MRIRKYNIFHVSRIVIVISVAMLVIYCQYLFISFIDFVYFFHFSDYVKNINLTTQFFNTVDGLCNFFISMLELIFSSVLFDNW